MSRLWWYTDRGNSRQGPVPHDEMNRLIDDGTISGDAMVWREGMPEWVRLSRLDTYSWPGMMEAHEMVRARPPTRAQTVRHFFFTALAIGMTISIAVYLYNASVQNAERENAKKTERERIKRERSATIAQLVKDTNAITDWDKRLSKGQIYRSGPIFTVELEQLWMSGRPILFLGAIDDIKTFDTNAYTVVLSMSSISSFMFDTQLRLSLQCNRSVIDPLLSSNPELIASDVAVIANVTAIRAENVENPEGANQAARIGEGSCLHVLYVDDPLPPR